MSKSVGKPLTVELIAAKTKTNVIRAIKNLNLWGNDLEDLRLLRQMGCLQVVSLSVNRISSLKQFSYCSKLQQIYLRKNNISDLQQIRYLTKLPNLKVLWLHDNPCASIQNYREIVLKYLPNLQKLDNNPVTQQQRIQAKKVDYVLNQASYEEQQKKTGYQQYQQSKKQRLQLKKQKQQKYIEKVEQEEKNSQNSRIQQDGYYQPRINVSNVKNVVNSNNLNNSNIKSSQKNKNILMAVISLIKELDINSLEIARLQTQKLLQQRQK